MWYEHFLIMCIGSEDLGSGKPGEDEEDTKALSLGSNHEA
jgi:hypothetical protein